MCVYLLLVTTAFSRPVLVQGGDVRIYHMRRQEGAYLIQTVLPNPRTLSQ